MRSNLTPGVGGTGTGTYAGISFQYEDASAVDAWDMEATQRTDNIVHTTMQLRANQGTAADAIVVEKNEGLSDNTHESYVQMNAGIRYTQFYTVTSGTSLTMDRGFYRVIVDDDITSNYTINLPEISGVTENYTTGLANDDVGVGQEFVISNYEPTVTVTVAVFTGDIINNVTNGTVVIPPNKSLLVRAERVNGSAGQWSMKNLD
jgi:hypothetical protein